MYGRQKKVFRGRKRTYKRRSVFKKGPPNGGTLRLKSNFGLGVMIAGGTMPNIVFVKHDYRILTTLEDAGPFQVKSLRPNDLTDIDGAGQNASRFQTFVGFYNLWCVVGFSYKVTLINLDNTDSMIGMVVPWGRDETPASQAQMEYMPGCKQKVLSHLVGHHAMVSFSGYVNINSLVGVKVVNEDDYCGTVDVAPANKIRFYVGIANMDGSGDSFNIQVQVSMKLYTKWSSPNQTAAPAFVDSGGGGTPPDPPTPPDTPDPPTPPEEPILPLTAPVTPEPEELLSFPNEDEDMDLTDNVV